MLPEFTYTTLKKLAFLVLLIAGFFVFSYQIVAVSFFSIIYAILLILCASLLVAFLDLPGWMAAAAGFSVGAVSGYIYAIILCLLALLFYAAVRYFLMKKQQLLFLVTRIDDFLGAMLLGIYSAYPFLVFGLHYVFVFVLPLFYGIFIFLLNRLPEATRIEIETVNSGEKISFLFLPLISLIAVSYLSDIKVLPFVLLLGLYPSKAFLERFYRFNPQEIVVKTADYLASSVFGSRECMLSFRSLADAISEARKDDLSSDDLYLVYLLSTLAWSSFSKTLYRQPDQLSQDELNLLGDNLLSLKKLLSLADFKEEIAEAVCLLYENYDGSGVPYGKNGGEIPLLSRLVRVMEKYLLLTSWKEGIEPLTDLEAIKKIKEGSGILYDPHAVELLSQIITPPENMAERKELLGEHNFSTKAEGVTEEQDVKEEAGDISPAGGDTAGGQEVER